MRGDAAFVSPRDVSAAEKEKIQSLYPHWFEERDGRKCLKLIVSRVPASLTRAHSSPKPDGAVVVLASPSPAARRSGVRMRGAPWT